MAGKWLGEGKAPPTTPRSQLEESMVSPSLMLHNRRGKDDQEQVIGVASARCLSDSDSDILLAQMGSLQSGHQIINRTNKNKTHTTN